MKGTFKMSQDDDRQETDIGFCGLLFVALAWRVATYIR